MTLLKLFLFSILKGVLAVDNNDTERVQLWRAQGNLTEEVLKEFYDRARFTEDIWKRDNRTIDFLIYEFEMPYVSEFLEEYNVSHKVLIEDVHGIIDEGLVNSFPTRRNAMSKDSLTWTAYPSLNEIYSYLKQMAKNYPQHCKLETIGQTAHKKPIYMVKILSGRSGTIPILVDGGTHGREWTSVISALYLIDSLARNFPKQPEYVQKKDWYIIPVLNPDGYDYSLTTDHLWKKNRRKLSGGCYGVDLNRNFDHNWGKEEALLMVCGKNYCGPVPFSEEETKAFKRLTDGTHFKAYLSIHSAGTKVLYPWTHLGPNSPDYHKHLSMTKEIALAMRKVSNYHFVNTDIKRLGVQQSSGMAIDWMYFVKEIIQSYMIETRGGFGVDLIPGKQILTAVKEVRAGIFRFAEVFQ